MAIYYYNIKRPQRVKTEQTKEKKKVSKIQNTEDKKISENLHNQCSNKEKKI